MTSILNISDDTDIASPVVAHSLATLPNGDCLLGWITSEGHVAVGYPTSGGFGAVAVVFADGADTSDGLSICPMGNFGAYAVIWSDGADVYCQLVSQYNFLVGSPFVVNTYTHDRQWAQSATRLSNGGFVVTWVNEDGDGSGWSVSAQLFDASGAKVAYDDLVNTTFAGYQMELNVGALTDGGYVVTWTTKDAANLNNGGHIFGQRYNASGAKVGGEFQIDAAATAVCRDSVIVGTSDGGFVAVWEDEFSFDVSTIVMQRFDSTGHAVGGETLISDLPESRAPAISTLSDGGFVIAWESNGDVFTQRFDAVGHEFGGIFLVTNDSNYASDPCVTALDNGGFTVAWTEIAGGTYHLVNRVFEATTDTSGSQVVYGTAGNDLLDGGAADDLLFGGYGNDTYVVDNAGDWVVENTGEGTDIVNSSVTFTLGDNVENLTLTGTSALTGTGNALANVITGNSGGDTLIGLGGNDTLTSGTGTDALYGGAGNDTYIINSVNDVVSEETTPGTDDGGTDLVKFSAGAGSVYTLTAHIEKLTLTGSNAINGTGNDLNNTITGNSAANLLDGGLGADTLSGGAGDDTYIVDNAGEVVTESASQGTDLVKSAVSYTIGNNVENLTLTGTASVNGTGNSLTNIITGNSGNNVLNGSTGADQMIGGAGDDTYYVDDAGDTIVEASGSGTDTVVTSVDFVMEGQYLDILIMTGSGNLSATGTHFATTISGNAGNNMIDGGAGADILAGGLGNDTYVVDNVGDVVTENTGEGTDTVSSSIAYTLGTNVENLILTGTSALIGTGNALDNAIAGNSGSDTLIGLGGNDTLTSGTGTDTLYGGSGNDTYIIDSASDLVNEETAAGTDDGGTDLVKFNAAAGSTYTLTTHVENLTLTGSNAINGTGNDLINIIIGNSAANMLDGGQGADNLSGGAGDDTYYVDNAGDTIVEASGSGTDTVVTSVDFVMEGQYLDILIMTGGGNLSATGTHFVTTIYGNTGNNVIDGGGGADTLAGGAGADTFLFNLASGADKITDFSATEGDSINVHAYTNGTANTSIISQSGANVLVDLGGGNTITVLNATVANVTAHMIW